MDVKTAFLNGDLDGEVDLTKEFLSSRFSMKDMGEADVILGIRIKHKSNGIVISQSHYIEKVVSQLEYSRVIGYLMYVMTYTRFDIAFAIATGKEAEWLKNLLLEILLWSKPITRISIRCDSAVTLEKAYSQIYNKKSRHLGVRHSMIRLSDETQHSPLFFPNKQPI
ncbi:zinc finger, CCHC-type containing protein [Tanacetum coccineum]